MKNQKTLEKIIKNDPAIKQAIDKDPKLYDSLRAVYMKTFDKYSGAIKAFDLVDKYDKYFAIAETALQSMGPGVNQFAYLGLKGVELLGKGLASTYYGAKTKDWGGIGKLVGMETVEFLTPFGDLGNLAPAYRMSARAMLQDKVTERFKADYLSVAKGKVIEFPKTDIKRKAA